MDWYFDIQNKIAFQVLFAAGVLNLWIKYNVSQLHQTAS